MSPSEKRDLDMMFKQQERQVGRPARTLDINRAKQARQRNRQRREVSVVDAAVAEGSPSCNLDPEELLRLLGEAPPTNPSAPSPRRTKRRTKRRRKAPVAGAKQQSSQEQGEDGEEEVTETLIDDVVSVLADSKADEGEEEQETVNIVEDAVRGAEESEEEEEKEEASPSTSSRGSVAIVSEDACEERSAAVAEEVTRRDVGVQAGSSKLHTVAWQLQDELETPRRRPSKATSGDGRETEIALAIEAMSHIESNVVGSASSTRSQRLPAGSASPACFASARRQQSWADIADTDEEEGGNCVANPDASKGCRSPSATSCVLRHASREEEAVEDTPDPEETPEPAVEECQKDDCSSGKVQAGVSQPGKARELKATIRWSPSLRAVQKPGQRLEYSAPM